MNKSFSSRIGNIEVIVELEVELRKDAKYVRILHEHGRVIKHDGDSSSILVSPRDYKIMCELQTNIIEERLHWHIRESADEGNHRNRIS